MAIKFIDDTILTAIANAIRSKLSSSDTYKPSEMATAIGTISGGITPTGTKQINTNGTHDVTAYASAEVNVPNSYSASDEGKVVSSGALVSQTSDTATQNGTVDTTLINSLTVNVASSGRTATYVATSTIGSPQALYNAIKNATGFTNLYAVCQSELPSSGACVRSLVYIDGIHGDLSAPNGYEYACYRRNSSGTWGLANSFTASITVSAGDEFKVYEIQPYE